MRVSRHLARISRHGAKLLLPLLLVPVIILGGASGEGFGTQAFLLMGAGICTAGALISWDATRPARRMLWPMGFLGTFVLVGLVQLVPLPAGFILGLPGRDVIGEGWTLLGIAPDVTPLSMAPARTFAALGAGLVPLAAFLVVFRLGWGRATPFLAWTMAGLGAASGLYGFAQILIPTKVDLYFHDFTSLNRPVGFFANANHQASFLLMSLPFTAALIGDVRAGGLARDDERARLIVAVSLGLVQLIGIMAVGSVSGYLLLAPTLLFSLLIMGSRKQAFSGRSSLLLAGVLVVGIGLVASSPILEGLGVTSFSSDGLSRAGMAKVTFNALEDHIWLGSGIGTFEPVFKLYEDPMGIEPLYANHAHNEYLQWALEAGLPGLALLAGFLAWWLVQFFRVWGKAKDGTARLRRAASIVTLIVFLHSFVDYPARTPAILALVSVCLALMVVQRRQSAPTLTGREGESLQQVTL